MFYSPARLIEYDRSGLIEQEHSGFLLKIGKNCKDVLVGDSNNYPFYLRSCAKPLQSSLVIDYGFDEFYNMTLPEIAITCASHAGEGCHVDVVRSFLDKIGISEVSFKCGIHKPLSKTEKEKLLLSGECENIYQNNCSGKHSMMLSVCKAKGWDLASYDDIEHPLQLAIKKKIYELCEIDGDYPITKDGCGVPIHSMPLKNMLIGYLNLFCDEKYSKIKEAFVQNPYLIGGEDRLDTAIMSANSNLIAKVGAGGICIVVNLERQEALIIKILDSDMKARAIAFINALSQLGWLADNQLEHSLIKAQNKTDILTLHKEKIGEVKFCFSI